MQTEFTIKTSSQFQNVSFDKDADNWYFVFTENISFNISTFWRLLNDKHIELVSLDHGHQFGLANPVDLSQLLTDALTGKTLLEIKVKKETADLLLTFSDNLEIEVFISSTGYETYNFSVNKRKYIGMGGGEIAVFEDV